MITLRQLFKQHVGQTSENPTQLEIEKAEGIYMFDKNGKKYIDLISGVSVSNVGHRHPKVIEAVKNQLDKYMHLMVYGEYVQSPQVKFAEKLTSLLPEELDNVYFVNSGSEANDAALKLAKRYTKRSEIIAFRNSYHGSTHGAFTLYGNEEVKRDYRPLLPDVRFLDFNNISDLQEITEKTACVMLEPIQAEAGIILPENDFLKHLRKRCNETGTLLILDEVQTGFGRTGHLFAFEKYNIVPDVFTIAKGMGGGMPIGALVASKKVMDSFKQNPGLGHITTFGGHPVSAASALACLEILIDDKVLESVNKKGELFRKLLIHPTIKSIRGTGLFLSVELENEEVLQKFMQKALDNGLVFDSFLFDNTRFRIAPPLTITEEEIKEAVERVLISLS